MTHHRRNSPSAVVYGRYEGKERIRVEARKVCFFPSSRTCSKCRIPRAEGVARRVRFVVIPKWRIIMYNARAFFFAGVLVHVGAPVRESTFGSKVIHTAPLPPPNPSVVPFVFYFYLPSCAVFLSSSFPLALPSSLFFSAARLGPCNGARPRLVLTRLIQMNLEDCSMYLGTNWILKIKKGE